MWDFVNVTWEGIRDTIIWILGLGIIYRGIQGRAYPFCPRGYIGYLYGTKMNECGGGWSN